MTDRISQIPSWARAAIAFVSSAIGLGLLIRANLQLAITIIGASVLLGLFGLLLYLSFAKTPPLVVGGKGQYRYPRFRTWSLLGTLLTFVLTIVLLSMSSTQLLILAAFTQDKERPSIAQVLLSESEGNYFLEIIVDNPSSRAFLINSVDVNFSNPTQADLIPICCLMCTQVKLVLHEPVNVTLSNRNRTQFIGAFDRPEQVDYVYPFNGTFQPGCTAPLMFGFGLTTSVVLSPERFTNVGIVFPRKFEISYASTAFDPEEKPREWDLEALVSSEQVCVSLRTNGLAQPLALCKR